MSLSREIVVEVVKNNYTIKFPNTGELLDIDLLKIQITNGRYDTLKFSLNPSFQHTALKVDTVAFFNTMVPKLKKDLTVKSLFDLEEDQLMVLVKVYEDEVLPWLEEWESILRNPVSASEEDKKD